MWASAKRFLVGQPLSNEAVSHQRLSKKKALAVFSSDALSSVAYATEAILAILVTAKDPGAAVPWTWPLSISIVALLGILVLSYRQTISAYPGGGGAYTVCKENLGDNQGLIAAAALIIDYILTVAVSIAAGTAAVTSAFPELTEHRVLISVVAIFILMLMNLRGIRESGTVFSIPTYIFIFSIFGMFIWLGAVSHGVPLEHSVALMPHGLQGIGLWIVLVAFANGCTALTGVEAISNGVTAFRHPEQHNAKVTLVWMAVILASMFLGISYFAHLYGILPKDDETVISQLAHHLNNPTAYYTVQAATAAILFLAANTSFNDFPRVASLLADDRYLPRQLASRGDRLVFSNGIIGLGLVSMFLIWIFNADVILLLPIYAIGVFLCFSMSQAGMVKHWFEYKGPGWIHSAVINALGCVTTSVALVVIVMTKFPSGGWIVCLMIPSLVILFRRIRHHYVIVGRQLGIQGPPPPVRPPYHHRVVIPVSGIHRGVLEALNYGRSISGDITACFVDISPRATEKIKTDWERYGMGVPLKTLHSPFRSVMRPLLDYIDEELQRDMTGMITVIIPEFVTARWWQSLLHNQTAIFIRTALTFRRRVVVTSVRYHLAR
jgi:amino acid transporter